MLSAGGSSGCDALVCTKGEQFCCCCIFIIFLFLCNFQVIRYFTAVKPEDYFWPCNNTNIIPESEIKIFKIEKEAYDKIIKEYEHSSTLKNSTELQNLKTRNRDVENRIKLQNCYRQKCAKINIQNNLEAIKDKITTISTWLFRVATVLLLLSGILCYYQRQSIHWKCGIAIFVVFVIAPIFTNAFISMFDYSGISNFEINC